MLDKSQAVRGHGRNLTIHSSRTRFVAAIFKGKSFILIAATKRVGLIQVLDLARGESATVKNIIVLIVLASLAWFGYGKFKAANNSVPGDAIATPAQYASADQAGEAEADSPFKCDGRTMCPQMTSCAEATYFIKHCPNTKMDGNNDGVPCERQWCN